MLKPVVALEGSSVVVGEAMLDDGDVVSRGVVEFVKGWMIMIDGQDCNSIRSSVEIRFSCQSLADRVREVRRGVSRYGQGY